MNLVWHHGQESIEVAKKVFTSLGPTMHVPPSISFLKYITNDPLLYYMFKMKVDYEKNSQNVRFTSTLIW